MIQTIEIKLEIENHPPTQQSEFIARISKTFQEGLCAEVVSTQFSISEEDKTLREIACRDSMRAALELIGKEPQWFEIESIDLETGKVPGEWQDGAYFSSPMTESEQLSPVVTTARNTVKKLDREFGADRSKSIISIEESKTPKTPRKRSKYTVDHPTQLFD